MSCWMRRLDIEKRVSIAAPETAEAVPVCFTLHRDEINGKTPR